MILDDGTGERFPFQQGNMAFGNKHLEHYESQPVTKTFTNMHASYSTRRANQSSQAVFHSSTPRPAQE